MRVQYIHDGASAELSLTAETDAERLMLATLESPESTLEVKLVIERKSDRRDLYGYHEPREEGIRAVRVLLTQKPWPDEPEPQREGGV